MPERQYKRETILFTNPLCPIRELDLPVEINEAIEYIKRCLDDAVERGYRNIYIEEDSGRYVCQMCRHVDQTLVLVGERLETDEELEARVKREEVQEKRNREVEEDQRVQDIKQYEHLRKKLGFGL